MEAGWPSRQLRVTLRVWEARHLDRGGPINTARMKMVIISCGSLSLSCDHVLVVAGHQSSLEMFPACSLHVHCAPQSVWGVSPFPFHFGPLGLKGEGLALPDHYEMFGNNGV